MSSNDAELQIQRRPLQRRIVGTGSSIVGTDATGTGVISTCRTQPRSVVNQSSEWSLPLSASLTNSALLTNSCEDSEGTVATSLVSCHQHLSLTYEFLMAEETSYNFSYNLN